MGTKAVLENALKEAMRAGDDLRKRTLRMALSAIRQIEIDKGLTLDESAVMAVLHKEIKSRQEAVIEAQRAGRPDLEAASKAEISVLEGFLPKMLSAEELETIAQQVITETGAVTQRDMGKVMKVLVPRLEGRASGDQVSQVVRKLLQN